MKYTLIISGILLLMILSISCDGNSEITGNRNYTTLEHDLNEFQSVSNPFPGTVRLKNGNYKIRINAESNILDMITYKIDDKMLILGSDDVNFESNGIDFEIYSQDFNYLINDGSANWTSDSLNIDPMIISNGSGKIELTGKSTTQKIQSNGSGDINLTSMPTENINIEASSTGEILVNVSNNAEVLVNGSGSITLLNLYGILVVTINGSGNVYYSGNPSEIRETLNGSGKVIELQ